MDGAQAFLLPPPHLNKAPIATRYLFSTFYFCILMRLRVCLYFAGPTLHFIHFRHAPASVLIIPQYFTSETPTRSEYSYVDAGFFDFCRVFDATPFRPSVRPSALSFRFPPSSRRNRAQDSFAVRAKGIRRGRLFSV